MDRRHFLLTSGATALLMSAPALAKVATYDDVSAEEVAMLREIDAALENLDTLWFTISEQAPMLGVVGMFEATKHNPPGRINKLRFRLHDLITDERPEVRLDTIRRVRYANAIYERLAERYGTNLAPQILWLHDHGYPRSKTRADMMASGDYFALRAVALSLGPSLA